MTKTKTHKLSVSSTTAKGISKKNKELNHDSFLNAHWEIAHALLNGQINPAVANAVAAQTSRIIGFKKLEIERAKLLGEKINVSLLGKK